MIGGLFAIAAGLLWAGEPGLTTSPAHASRPVVEAADEAAAAPTTALTATTRVMEVLANGRSQSAAGMRVWLLAGVQKPGPRGGTEELVHRMSTLTDDKGRATFVGIPAIDGAQYRFEVQHQGVPFRSQPFQAGQPAPSELRVFPVSAVRPKGDGVRLRMQAVVETAEAYLNVTQHIRVENQTNEVWDADACGGLRLPTLSFVALGGLANWGLFPDGRPVGGPRPSTDIGRVVGEKGTLVFRGPVPPGNELFFQLTYSVPYSRESARLGLVADLPIEELVVTFREPDGHDLDVQLERPNRAFVSDTEGQGQVDALVEGRVPAGELVAFRVGRLPAESWLPRRLAGSVSLGLALFAVPWVAGQRWRRRRSG